VSACAHPARVSRRLWVRGTRASSDWQPPVYVLRVTLCSHCGALQPDASNTDVVSETHPGEENS